MRILHIISTLKMRGAEKLLTQIAPRLKALGHDVEIAVLDGRDTPFSQQLQSQGIRVHHNPRKSLYHPHNISWLRGIIDASACPTFSSSSPSFSDLQAERTIVHTHTFMPQVYGAVLSKLTDARFITTEHNTNNHRRDLGGFKLFDWFTYAAYDKIICVSDAVKDALLDYLHINENKIAIVPNGIDLSEFGDNSWHSPLNKTVIQVAAFHPQKDQATTLMAFACLPREYKLKFVGVGKTKQNIEELAFILGVHRRVEFLGEREDVAELLKDAEVCVVSSYWEGFGLVALEAMAAGTPVVATDVPGLAQTVGDAGILTPWGNYKDVADEILRLASDPLLRYKMIEEGHRRAARYNIDANVSELLNIYSAAFGLPFEH